jgi:hypothetical protein
MFFNKNYLLLRFTKNLQKWDLLKNLKNLHSKETL